MTVSELIEKLKDFPQDATVLVWDNEQSSHEFEAESVYMRGDRVEISWSDSPEHQKGMRWEDTFLREE